jgi:vitamin B12 transporter
MFTPFRRRSIAIGLLSFSTFPVIADTVLDPVVVVATRTPTPTKELLADVTVLDRDEITAAGPEATLGEVLGRIAGVELSRQGMRGATEGIYIRGANTGHTLVLVDGLRMGSATLGQASISMIPVNQIERIEVLRGAASALYGSDAIGGVVLITTRSNTKNRLDADIGYGSHGSYSANLTNNGNVGGIDYSIKIGETGAQGINAVTNRNSAAFNPDKDGYNHRDFSLHLSKAISSDHELGAEYLRNEGWNRYDSSYPSANSDWKTNHIVNATSTYLRSNLTEGWQSTLRIGQSEDETIDTPSTTVGKNNDTFRTTQDQMSWQNDIRLPLGTAMVLFEHLHEGIASTNTFTRTGRTNDSLALGWVASAGDHSWQLATRQDRNSQFGGHSSETAAYGYKLSQDWRVTTSYGTSFKAPSFNDLYFPNTPFVGVGNPNLKPEEGRNSDIALHWEKPGEKTAITYFDNHIKNLINWEETPPGSWFYTPSNVDEAHISGWSAEYQGHIGDWNIGANYSNQDPKAQATGKQLTNRAKQFGGITFGQQIGRWNFGTEVRTSGVRYGDTANTLRMGGYTVVNLYGSYMLTDGWSAFVRAENIFDRPYELARSSTTNYASLGVNIFLGLRYQLK